MGASFLKITCKRILKSRKFLSILIYILILPLIILLMNDWAVDTNSWNVVFFIFGNRFIYFLFIIPVFLILLHDLANDGNLRYCAGRLITKATMIKAQLMTMFLLSIFLTIYVFSVVMIEAFLVFDVTVEWSSKTTLGLDLYTLFSHDLPPLTVISLFAIKFFMTLIFIGSFYFCWQSVTKRQYSSIGMMIISFLLFFNAVFNFRNFPFLHILDLSFVSVYHANDPIVLSTFISHIPLCIGSIGFLFCSLRLSKEVNL